MDGVESEFAKELMLDAIERFSPVADREFLEEYWDNPSARNAPGGVSRQARHARIARARRIGIIGSAISAAGCAEFETFVQSEAYGTLRPLAAEYQSTFWHLLEEFPEVCAQSVGRLWELGVKRLFYLAQRTSQASRAELLSMQGALTLLYAGPLAQGIAFRDRWLDLWSEVKRKGYLQNRYLRMQLAIMGTYVGECGSHVDWMLDKDLRNFDLADTFLFVRRDGCDKILDQTAMLIRGDSLVATNCLSPARPMSTLRHLGNYIKMCMRSTNHFANEGQVLMLLGYVEYLWMRSNGLPQDQEFIGDTKGLFAVLQQIECIELLEKSRFWSVFERTQGTPVRDELMRLWQRTLTEGPSS